uniref:Protein kinase domain-containing protein n=1 Tax=Strix occidentalis caurina TaxID=311401 RepID=A0A8D0KTR8_STROC
MKKAVLVLVKPKEKEDNRVVDAHPHVNGEAEGKTRRRRWVPRVGFSPGGCTSEPPITQPKEGKIQLPSVELSPGDPEFNQWPVMTQFTPHFSLGAFRGEGTPKFQLPKLTLSPQPCGERDPLKQSTGEVVAIKILKKKRYHGRVVKKELKLLQALRGVDTEESHIVRFLESFADGACTYLVFELLEQNLRDFQKKNNFLPLPVRHIRTITVQLLAALLKLKELSTIHADLKPENIMLVDHARYPFHVKLVDFGSACTLTEACHIKQPYIQTRFYRAPEILLGLPFCEKVDVWSLGCVMAELHLGWPLYPGINEYDQVRYICSTLGAPGEEMVKPVERRRYVFSSLDQLEALAEHCDLRGMVALLKTMLTWDSQERITPSAALEHPFISLQQVKSSFEATQYYQLWDLGLRRAGRHHEQPLRGARRLSPSTHQTAARRHAALKPRYSPLPRCSGSGYRRRRQGI